ncbi:MAG: site-specific DNA-methyltransferase [bacterium]|nr:site-specific DNA-methyltransferase [bacterium]
MATIDISKTELVWPGKYNEDGTRKEVPKVKLPFQVIETINESRATREAKKQPRQISLFDVYEGKEGDSFEEGWKNKLIWGDNLLVMGSLLEKFAGKIDLIYIDPPFATGADFSFSVQIGEESIKLDKEQSIIEEKAYRDTWGRGIDSYLQMIYDRLMLIRELLNEKGSIYVHLDWHVGHYIKSVLDEVFGWENFRNEIIWKRSSAHSDSNTCGNAHDTMFLFSKGEQFTWNSQYQQYDSTYIASHYGKTDEQGRRFGDFDLSAKGLQGGGYYYEWNGIYDNWRCPVETMQQHEQQGRLYYTKPGRPRYKRYLDEMPGMSLQDLWLDIPPVNSQAAERLAYITQKPERLLERIIKASSDEGDLVVDFFCGSGTTLAVAEKLSRRWIGCDLGRFAIHTTRKRLLGIENCKPFEILNLGKYERQYWQGVTFGKGKTVTEQSLYEYLAFILKLYGAQPLAGLAHLHGKKGKALVHIGAVDVPVTIDEINAALEECLQLKQTELHIVGWEWEMGLNDLMVTEAKKRGVKLLLLQIPREVMEQQAVDKGDVRFFELAYLEVEIQTTEKQTAVLTLKDFVIPNTELIPDEVRQKITKWSDYIDYWAVDWDFQHDTFMQGWVTYRTRKNRTLALTSDAHTYEKPGTYRILVKVIDIFGNDTSQVFEVEVRS